MVAAADHTRRRIERNLHDGVQQRLVSLGLEIRAIQAGAAADRLRLLVRDDGAGGAEVGRGSGLIGLADRVQALGGTIAVHGPAGQGTTLEVELPIEPGPDAPPPRPNLEAGRG